MSAIDALIGAVLSHYALDSDGVTLWFGGGSVLRIDNPWRVQGGGDLDVIVGRTVASIQTSDSEMDVVFDCGASVSVDLTPASFRGPEAAVLMVPGEDTVVWQ